MQQLIAIERNRTPYESRSAAITALNTTIVQKEGKPLLHRYFDTDGTTIKALFTIGTGNGIGENYYQLLADDTELQNAMVYNNDEPTLSSLGGIKAGSTFDNVSIQDMFTKLLYPYMAPTISLSASPSGGIREFGDTISQVTLTAKYDRKSEALSVLKFYRNNVAIHTDDTVRIDGQTSHVDTTLINKATTFKASIQDATGTVINSSTVSYSFVYPIFVGALATDEPTSEQITTLLSKKIQSSVGLTQTFTFVDKRIVLALPPGKKLTKATDPNGFDITSSFGSGEIIEVTDLLDGTTQNYTVYMNDISSQTGFKVTFA